MIPLTKFNYAKVDWIAQREFSEFCAHLATPGSEEPPGATTATTPLAPRPEARTGPPRQLLSSSCYRGVTQLNRRSSKSPFV